MKIKDKIENFKLKCSLLGVNYTLDMDIIGDDVILNKVNNQREDACIVIPSFVTNFNGNPFRDCICNRIYIQARFDNMEGLLAGIISKDLTVTFPENFKPTNIKKLFYGCTMSKLTIENMDISLVNDYLYMFAYCTELKEICIPDISTFAKINHLFTNDKNSQDTQYMFLNCKNLKYITTY